MDAKEMYSFFEELQEKMNIPELQELSEKMRVSELEAISNALRDSGLQETLERLGYMPFGGVDSDAVQRECGNLVEAGDASYLALLDKFSEMNRRIKGMEEALIGSNQKSRRYFWGGIATTAIFTVIGFLLGRFLP